MRLPGFPSCVCGDDSYGRAAKYIADLLRSECNWSLAELELVEPEIDSRRANGHQPFAQMLWRIKNE
jgi:hypothetical protein